MLMSLDIFKRGCPKWGASFFTLFYKILIINNVIFNNTSILGYLKKQTNYNSANYIKA